MPVLTQGQSADLTFADSDSVTIQAGSGTATFESPIGTVVAVFSGTRTFGPYSNRTGRVTATTQSVYYEFADGVGPTRNVTYQDGASPTVSGASAGAVLSGSVAKSASNVTRTSMAGYIRARAKCLAGQRGRVLFIGDSTTVGAGAGTAGAGTTALTGARAKNYPTQLAALLRASGINATNDHFWGSQGVTDDGVTYPGYDARMGALNAQSNWVTNMLGGKMLLLTPGSPNGALAFTPVNPCDGATIFYARVAGGGTATVNVDGGATLATINASGASAVLTQNVTFTRGTHTLNIAHNGTGTNFYIVGVLFTDSTQGAIDFVQAGYFGATTNLFAAASQPWDPVNVAGTLAPDHTFYELGINDAIAGLPIATFEANIRTMADRLISVGSGITFVVNVPFTTASASVRSNAAAIRAKVMELAAYYGAAVLDTPGYWGAHPSDPGSLIPASWYFDSPHPTALGYGDKAAWKNQSLRAV